MHCEATSRARCGKFMFSAPRGHRSLCDDGRQWLGWYSLCFSAGRFASHFFVPGPLCAPHIGECLAIISNPTRQRPARLGEGRSTRRPLGFKTRPWRPVLETHDSPNNSHDLYISLAPPTHGVGGKIYNIYSHQARIKVFYLGRAKKVGKSPIKW